MTAPDDPRSDTALLAATATEPEAFAFFYRRHAETVLRYFGARTREPELAADLMAETFAAALLGAARYRPRRDTAIAWVLGIAKHKLADSHRRGAVDERARRRLGLEPLWLDDEDLECIVELSGRDESGRDVLDLLDTLPPEQRGALMARVVDERGYPDIATEMECSQSVVRQRVSRALRTLRQQIEEPS